MTTESQPAPGGRLTIGDLVAGVDTRSMMGESMQHLQDTLREVARHQVDLTPLTTAVEQALRPVREQIRMSLADLPPIDIDLSFLNNLLRDNGHWQELAGDMRGAVAHVLDDIDLETATRSVEEVPEEAVAELEERAAQFAASVPGPIPPAMLQQAFAVYVAALVLISLVQVSLVSDTANALLDEVGQHAQVAGVAYVLAWAAWGRVQRRNEDE